jgi:hypothetical protein
MRRHARQTFEDNIPNAALLPIALLVIGNFLHV